MTRYIIRRLIGMVLLLILVSGVTFVVFNVFPSTDPAALRAGRQPTPQIIERIREDLGLDRPLMPATIALTIGGVLVWPTFGLSVGILSAVKHRSVLDRTAIGLSLIAISAHAYWLGLVASRGVRCARSGACGSVRGRPWSCRPPG
jgi:peptide/nickel transport system permease protein